MRRLQPVPDAPRRAGLYVRVSKVGGRAGEDFLSPTIQTSAMETAAARAGDRVVEVWQDFDRTGRTVEGRDGLAAAQAAAAAGTIDVLYVYSLHRWARNAADGLAELAAIERHGVPVVSATENVERTSASGRLTVGMLLLLAEHQSDLISESWKGAIRANAERGVWHGKPPIGYVRGERRELLVDPVLGPHVAEAFRTYSVGAGSIQSLARELGRIKGGPVYAYNLRKALRSEAYLGRVVLNGQAFEGRHPALIDEQTFALVQERLDRNSRTPARTLQATHALAGLVRCDGCGVALWRRTRSNRPTLPPFLACRSKVVDGSSTCPGIGTPRVEDVEAVVVEAVRRALVDVADTSAAQATRLARQAQATADLTVVGDEIARARRSLGVLAVKLAEGVLSATAYTAGVEQLERTLAGLEERRAAAEEASALPTFHASKDLAAALVELWPAMTPQERNAALRTHVREVRVRRAERRGEPVEDRVRVVFR